MRKDKAKGIRSAGLIWLLLLFTTVMTAAVQAADHYVVVDDQAGLLASSQISQVEESALSLSEETGWDVMVISTDDAQGSSTMDYADDYYDEHCSQKDGVAVLIDMDNREYYVSTSGLAVRYLTDDRIEDILDHAYDDMRNGSYAQAYLNMLADIGDFCEDGIYADQYNYDSDTGSISYYKEYTISRFEAMLAVILGLVTAGAIFFGVYGRYTMKTGRYHYVWQKNIRADISRRRDQFVNRVVTRRQIPRDPPRGGGGGGGHMSTTHHSSGGGSHGGGGRGF